MRTTLLSISIVAALCGALLAQDLPTSVKRDAQGRVLVGAIPYEKLATREATEKHMLDLLTPEAGNWGDVWTIAPFDFAGYEGTYVPGDFQRPREPESELPKMAANGPGPDLTRVFKGKKGFECKWKKLDQGVNILIDLDKQTDPELNVRALGYVYAQIKSDTARTVEVTMGSDDGARMWLNGRIVNDKDVPRGLEPTEDRIKLPLEAGVNHMLLKVSQGGGQWSFQINTRGSLSDADDALLYFLLDRDFPPSREREHYRVLTFPAPPDVLLETGGIAFRHDQKPMVSTRRGDVWLIENAYHEPPLDVRYVPFARGLHEALGLGIRQDADGEGVYAVQRGELTRMVDDDGDDAADRYDAFCNEWHVSGNYHEFAFGPKFDADGNAWVSLNVGFCGSLGKALVPWRGSALKIDKSGHATWICDGLRSPNGIGFLKDGRTAFYVDNQGDYVGTNKLAQLIPGSWHGHPASLRWRSELKSPDERPWRQPPAVWFPYKKMGQSVSDICLDDTGGKFGPFDGQFFVGDQTLCTIFRVALENVEGHYQGACFPFLEGLGSGITRLAFAPDGSMFVGETDRGWGSTGRKRYGLERVIHTGATPFEILAMHAQKDGFELTFTADVDPKTAGDPASYTMSSYTYEYHAQYGSPEIDPAPHTIVSATVTGPRVVKLVVDRLRHGYVHELSAAGVTAKADGKPLLHAMAYYTAINVPGEPPHHVAPPADLPTVLFFTRTAPLSAEIAEAFGMKEKDVAARAQPEHLSFAEIRLTEAALGKWRVIATQDPAALTPENLQKQAALVLLASGDNALPDAAKSAITDWVNAGGALVALHGAAAPSQAFPANDSLIGATTDGTLDAQTVTIHVEDAASPIVAGISGGAFKIADSIPEFATPPQGAHVILSLDPKSFDASKAKHADQPHPIAWTRAVGKGHVCYLALGHGEAAWRNANYQRLILNAIDWTRAAK